MIDDDEIDRRHAELRAVVQRACGVMGWPLKSVPTWSSIRAIAIGKAVAISVEKLGEMLDRIEAL